MVCTAFPLCVSVTVNQNRSPVATVVFEAFKSSAKTEAATKVLMIDPMRKRENFRNIRKKMKIIIGGGKPRKDCLRKNGIFILFFFRKSNFDFFVFLGKTREIHIMQTNSSLHFSIHADYSHRS